MKPTGDAVARAAVALLGKARIPYVMGGDTLAGMDCQGLIEYCVRQAGGKMSYAGSNDMYRNACEWVGTLAEARARGALIPGAVLFIVERNGGEPAKYKADGLGNASHAGLYTNMDAEVVHSSYSRGCVAASTLQNGWTHVGLLKAVAYGDGGIGDGGDSGDGAGDSTGGEDGEGGGLTGFALTHADTGSTVNMRKTPGGQFMLRIPLGTRVPVMDRQRDCTLTMYDGFTGWVKDEFLWFEHAGSGEDDDGGTGDGPDEGEVPAGDCVEVPRAELEQVAAMFGAWLKE